MADKTQNINIVYNFNTTAIDKAAQSLANVNKATNQLQQSAAKVGQSSSVGGIVTQFEGANKQITFMKTSLDQLKQKIVLTSDPKEVAKLSAAYATVKKQLDEATKSAFGFGKATTEATKGVGGLVTQFNQLSKLAGLGLMAGFAKEAVGFTLEMAKLQGRVEGVERGFTRAFENPIEILGEVREATHGTMTDFELMQRTLQATNLGVGVEHLGTLFEFASARAQQTGESVDYLVDSIVRGIGRKSPLVLDNLGISVTALKEKFDGASIASMSVAEATEGVAEIAREQLEKMGGYVTTAETGVKQLETAWENLRITFAKKIDSSGMVNFFTGVANGINHIIKGQQDLATEEAKATASRRLGQILDNTIFDKKKEHQLEQLDMITKEISLTMKLINTKERELKEFEKAQAADPIQMSAFPGLTVTDEQVRRAETKKAIEDQLASYKALLPMLANALRLKQTSLNLDNDALISLDKLIEKRDKMVEQFKQMEGADVPELLRSDKVQKAADDIQAINKQIKELEDLLKPPKELKIKITWAKTQEDFTEEWQQDIFNSFAKGGDLEKVVLNPFTAKAHDQGAIDATENISEEWLNDFEQQLSIFEEEALKASAKTDAAMGISGTELGMSGWKTFWARFRLGAKGEGGDSSEMQADLEDAIMELKLGGIDIFADQLKSEADMEAESYDRRLRVAKQFFETNQILAGDNEKAKDQLRLLEDKRIAALRKKQFIAEQKAAKQRALIDGAAAIVKTFVSYGGYTPAALIAAALQAAMTASQIAIINNNQPKFAKGVIDIQGPGTTTSDSIPARLSKHESVMTAWETKNAGGILKEIRAKKLDDRVLRNLREGRHPVQGMSDERIVNAINKIKAPDVIMQSGIVYKATKKSDDYISKQRAKSVRI